MDAIFVTEDAGAVGASDICEEESADSGDGVPEVDAQPHTKQLQSNNDSMDRIIIPYDVRDYHFPHFAFCSAEVDCSITRRRFGVGKSVTVRTVNV